MSATLIGKRITVKGLPNWGTGVVIYIVPDEMVPFDNSGCPHWPSVMRRVGAGMPVVRWIAFDIHCFTRDHPAHDPTKPLETIEPKAAFNDCI